MLTITDQALEAIRTLAREADAPGVRISAAAYSMNGSGPAVQLQVTPEPDVEDEILDLGGTKVFLAPSTAVFEDKVLDAEVEPDGIRFELHARD